MTLEQENKGLLEELIRVRAIFDKLLAKINLASAGNLKGVTDAYYEIDTIRKLDATYEHCQKPLEDAEDLIYEAMKPTVDGIRDAATAYERKVERLEGLLREVLDNGVCYSSAIEWVPDRKNPTISDFEEWEEKVKAELSKQFSAPEEALTPDA